MPDRLGISGSARSMSISGMVPSIPMEPRIIARAAGSYHRYRPPPLRQVANPPGRLDLRVTEPERPALAPVQPPHTLWRCKPASTAPG